MSNSGAASGRPSHCITIKTSSTATNENSSSRYRRAEFVKVTLAEPHQQCSRTLLAKHENTIFPLPKGRVVLQDSTQMKMFGNASSRSRAQRRNEDASQHPRTRVHACAAAHTPPGVYCRCTQTLLKKSASTAFCIVRGGGEGL